MVVNTTSSVNRKRQIALTFLLFGAIILVATLPAGLSQSTAYPCTGTWDGNLGPGTGTVSVLGNDHQITTTSTLTGTFDGDTTHGNWVGKITTNYTVPDMSTNGHTVGDLKGTYVMSIDGSGTVTGTVTIPLSGDFRGQVKLTLQGQESQTGQLTGTWTGTMTVTQVTYNFLPIGANIVAPGSGGFTATEQRPASQTVASTSSAVPTTAEMTSTSAVMSSTTAEQSMTTQSSAQNVSYLPYALAAVVVVIIIGVGAYALRMRRPKTS